MRSRETLKTALFSRYLLIMDFVLPVTGTKLPLQMTDCPSLLLVVCGESTLRRHPTVFSIVLRGTCCANRLVYPRLLQYQLGPSPDGVTGYRLTRRFPADEQPGF